MKFWSKKHSHLFSLVLALVLTLELAALADPPAIQESYTERPDILAVVPKAQPELSRNWKKLRSAHLEAVAQLIELYPDHQIYFLARDSELLYDFARLASKNDPALSARLHLLNISRTNMNAEHVKDYLTQEGISEETLRAGRKVLFVDTGFSGTIPRTLQEKFPDDLREQLQTHLMSSANPKHPSSRVFLSHLNPAAAEVHPSIFQASIIDYEHIPRYTDRSTAFARQGSRWVPMSPVPSDSSKSGSDGGVNKEIAQRYQRDLAEFFSRPESQALFAERRQMYRQLRTLADSGNLDGLRSALRQLLATAQDGENRTLTVAIVKDFIESQEKNSRSLGLSFTDFGLKEQGLNASNKNELIEKFPQWKSILEEPASQIKLLLQNEDFTTLGAILDVIQDKEFCILLNQEISKARPRKSQHVTLVESLIKKNKLRPYEILEYLAQPSWQDQLPKFIEMLLEQGNVDGSFIHNFFSGADSAKYPQLLERYIQASDETTDETLSFFALEYTHWQNHPDLRRLCGGKDPTPQCLREAFAQGKTLKHLEPKSQPLPPSCPTFFNTL